jgi:hypothetical protein
MFGFDWKHKPEGLHSSPRLLKKEVMPRGETFQHGPRPRGLGAKNGAGRRVLKLPSCETTLIILAPQFGLKVFL